MVYYAAYDANFLPTFRPNLSKLFSRVKKSWPLKVRTLVRAFAKELPLHAAQCPRRTQISFTSQRKH